MNAGTVRQSFSHGRSKTVVVETKRRRVPGPGERPELDRPAVAAQPRPAPTAPATPPAAPAAPASSGSANLNLSQSELAARQRALEAAAKAAEADNARRAEEAKRAEAAAAAAAAAQAPAPTPTPAPVEAAPEAPAKPATPATPVTTASAPAETAAPAPTQAAAPAAAPAAPPAEAKPAAPAAPAKPEERPVWERLSGRHERTERPARPAPSGGFGDRPRPAGGAGFGDRPRPEGGAGGFGARPRPEGGAGGGFGSRPRPEGGAGGGFGSRPRPEGGAGGGFGSRPRPEGGGFGDRPRPEGGDTVRYSALAPRPAGPRTGPGGARPGGPPGPRGAATPAAPEITKTTRSAPPRGGGGRDVGDDDDGARRRGPGGKLLPAKKTMSSGKGQPQRREGRLTIQVASGDGDSAERMRSLASVRRAREREREKRRGGVEDQQRVTREVVIPDAITVSDLAQRMATRAVDVIKFMMRQGAMLTINDVLDADTAELIASEFGHTVKRVSESDVETGFISADDAAEDTVPRAPVVAVMGHVDHGKTSLLDALRTTDVASAEHGGITQHIGAYQVQLKSGDKVTFLDTPGHAAFSAMRMRGANVTDIVVLVVAADDGVMPQTIEAINHAKAAGAPIIVAVNKMDKPDADPQRVINELLQHEIVVESLGGDTQIIEVSALKKTGLEALVEAIALQAEVMDLRANPDRSAEGVVIEGKLDKGRGAVATVLVKRGTLKRGDIVVAGAAWGRVRALVNERGEQLPQAGPSQPVEILGLDETPTPGDTLAVVENEARARELTEYRVRQKREKSASPVTGASLADMMAKLQTKKVSELPVLIKADVAGSAEAIVGSLDKLGTDEVRARIILSGAGAITESDVQLAKGSNAPILGFNVRASAQARALAEREGVEIRYYSIIYDLIDDIKGVLSGMLAPLQRETFLGNAEILQVFDITKVGKIAGCRVTEGVVRKGARVRVIRENVVVLELGTLQTLKRFKDEVNEVNAGQECGMNFAFQDIRQGDVIECFNVEMVARSL